MDKIYQKINRLNTICRLFDKNPDMEYNIKKRLYLEMEEIDEFLAIEEARLEKKRLELV